MKVFYMNDEQQPIIVRILDSNYDPGQGIGDSYHKLEATESKIFDVCIPETAILYVKKWKDIVMLSYIDLAAVAQSQEQPEHRGDE